ncbi:MAG: GNAT family N-acetyltransferase [Colwellia sp.]|nr:GNAT family N-acetyltransferase [Colwellia sp.]
MQIYTNELEQDDVMVLLTKHHQDMLNHSPEESVHALDLSALKKPDITFWTIRVNNELAGCCALKELDKTHGEIKSMRTAEKFLRQGIAKKLLQHILAQAKQRSYIKLSLETGTEEAFKPAHKMYHQFGFIPCQPFANYQDDPFSMFMSKSI